MVEHRTVPRRTVPHRTAPHRPGDERPSAPAGREPDDFRRVPTRNPLALPSARAVAGGLLVAVAVLGIFSAHRAASARDDARWLIVDRAVPSGRRITAADLALAPMRIPAATERRAIADPDDVVGKLALVTLRPGDLVVRSALASSAPTASSGRRVALALGSSDAMGGLIAEGDRVDVVAVGDSTTPAEVVVRGALVVTVGDEEGPSLGSGGGIDVTLDVADEESAVALIAANASSGVTLVGASPLDLRAGR